MNELIQITTDAQGVSVVSARELYGFLEVKAKFADWFVRRVDKYGLLEDQDYVTYSPLGEKGVILKSEKKGGRPEIDYILTIDAAKELAMVEGNEKGKQARAYFIACEKQLRQIADKPALPSSTETLLLQLAQQQAQLLTQQQAQLDQLRSDIGRIQAGTRPVRTRSTQLSLPHMRPSKDEDLRQRINQLVDEYCERGGYMQSEMYRYLYKCLQSAWGINVYQYPRRNGESWIDVIERYGHLYKLFSVVKAQVNFIQ